MINSKEKKRIRRKRRLRKRIAGVNSRLRLNVFRGLKNIHAQLIDDRLGVTLASASSLELDLKTKGSKTEVAREVGRLIGDRGRQREIKRVVFDRGGYLYHGRVKALAEGAREAGLEF